MSQTDPPTPLGIIWLRAVAACLVAAEALGLAVYGLYVAVETVVSTATERLAAGSLAVMSILVGAGLAVCAVGVWRGRRWSRAPVITWQLCQAAIAVPMATSGWWFVGVPSLVASIVLVIVLLGDRVVARLPDSGLS